MRPRLSKTHVKRLESLKEKLAGTAYRPGSPAEVLEAALVLMERVAAGEMIAVHPNMLRIDRNLHMAAGLMLKGHDTTFDARPGTSGIVTVDGEVLDPKAIEAAKAEIAATAKIMDPTHKTIQ